MHTILLAFDIGTSGLKASLVDENLNVLRNVTTSYPTHRKPGGGCEQDAYDWWMSAVRAMLMLRELAPEYVKKVEAVGISGHMLGCLPMDAEGRRSSSTTGPWFWGSKGSPPSSVRPRIYAGFNMSRITRMVSSVKGFP